MRKALAALGCVACFVGAPAYALPTLTFQLDSDHCSGTGGCVPDGTSGGTVVVTDNGDGSLTFLIDLADNYQIINGGFDASFGFNLVGNPTITYSGYPIASYTIPGGNPQSTAPAPGLHMDGVGYFEYGLDGIGNGASDPLGNTLTFTITDTLTLASLEQNADGQYFGVDISGLNGNTGGIDASGPGVPGGGGEIPEPGVVGLLGLGLVGLSALRRRRR